MKEILVPVGANLFPGSEHVRQTSLEHAQELLALRGSQLKLLANKESMYSIEHEDSGSQCACHRWALIYKGDCHRHDNGHGRDHFNAVMIKIGGFARRGNCMVQKFTAIAFDEPAPAHFAIAVCEPKKKIPIEILNMANDGVCRKQVHRSPKNNQTQCDQRSRESRPRYPPEMM